MKRFNVLYCNATGAVCMGFTVHAPDADALAGFIGECFDVESMQPGRATLYGAHGAYLSWGTPRIATGSEPTASVTANGKVQVNI